jgi:hypothetical protein
MLQPGENVALVFIYSITRVLKSQSVASLSQVVIKQEWVHKWDAYTPHIQVPGPDGQMRPARLQVVHLPADA